jgi:phosphoribosylaminoimidazole-succinocarboxamide synthase
MTQETMIESLTPFTRGKVRDVYDLGDRLLIATSDRISAYDVILPDPIPDKGKVLTAMSLFWFDLLGHVCPHHLISSRVEDYPAQVQAHAELLRDRSMLVAKAQRIDFECVVRGYIAGSLWKEYTAAQKQNPGQPVKLHGYMFPAGLLESQKLSQPIFTPATKADEGHDENVSVEYMVKHTGQDTAQLLQKYSLQLYSEAAAYAAQRGIIIADTKFEFGWRNGEIILIDEILSPDSSRFWPADTYATGRAQDSFDKQYVRDWLSATEWNKTPPAPALPADVVARTRAKYIEAYHRLVPPGKRMLDLT